MSGPYTDAQRARMNSSKGLAALAEEHAYDLKRAGEQAERGFYGSALAMEALSAARDATHAAARAWSLAVRLMGEEAPE